MGYVCWHNDHIPFVQLERLVPDDDLNLAIHDLDKGVVWCRVLAKPLPFGKREEAHCTLGLVDDHPAHDGSLLVLDQGLEDLDLRSNCICQIWNFLRKNWGTRILIIGRGGGVKALGEDPRARQLEAAPVCVNMGQADARVSLGNFSIYPF